MENNCLTWLPSRHGKFAAAFAFVGCDYCDKITYNLSILIMLFDCIKHTKEASHYSKVF